MVKHREIEKKNTLLPKIIKKAQKEVRIIEIRYQLQLSFVLIINN